MCSYPNWLPNLASVSPWTHQTFDILYQVFEYDFKHNLPILYRNNIVRYFLDIEDGKEQIFWHLTCYEERSTGERLADFVRAERLPWIRPMIEHPDKEEIFDWDYKEGNNNIHTYIWLKDYDFVVIMKKYKNNQRRLITAHYIIYDHKKVKLMKKYEKRIR